VEAKGMIMWMDKVVEALVTKMGIMEMGFLSLLMKWLALVRELRRLAKLLSISLRNAKGENT
jgi:hypothetical protein